MRLFCLLVLFFIVTLFAAAQEGSLSRGSIPEELIRPKRGESPYYPIDTVIGELGQGKASDEAYSLANTVAAGFLSGEMGHPSLASINPVLRENYLSALEIIEPGSFRIGGGKEEADGAVSFLIRFIGREQGITGELFVRYVTKQTERVFENENENGYEEAEIITTGNWVFDELILEEAKSRDAEQKENQHRFDFSPYERFF